MVAVIFRATYFFQYRKNAHFSDVSPLTDSIHFHQGALALLHGDWLARTGNNSYSPLYKYFIALLYALSQHALPFVWVVQFALGVVAGLMIYEIGLKCFNRFVGLGAALAFVTYGPLLMYEGLLLRESLMVFLGVAALYLLLQYLETPSKKNSVLLGCGLSLLMQVRPTTVFIVVFAFLFLGRRINLRLLVSFVLLSLPLLIVTCVVHGHFVFYDASGPNALFIGNLVGYSGQGFYGLEDKGVQTLISHYGATYPGFLKYLKEMVTEVPFDFLKMYGRKIYFLCSNYEIPSNYNFYLFSQFAPVLKAPHSAFAFFLSAGIFGVALATWKNLKLWPLYIFFFGFLGAALPFHNEARFRLPWLPVLMLFSFYFLWEVFVFYKKGRGRLAVAALFMLLATAFSLRNPVALARQVRADDYAILAMMYAQNADLPSLTRAESASGLCWNALVQENRSTEEVRQGLDKIYRKMLTLLIERKDAAGMQGVMQKITVLFPENQEAKSLLENLSAGGPLPESPSINQSPLFPFQIAPW